MIQLGCFHPSVTAAARDAYIKHVEDITRAKIAAVADGSDKLTLRPSTTDAQQPMTVADIQQGLKPAGFCPG